MIDLRTAALAGLIPLGFIPLGLAQACSVDTSLFGTPPAADGGAGGASSSSSSSSMGGDASSSSSSTSTSSTSSGMGGDPSTSSSSSDTASSTSSGMGGRPNDCSHDICDEGAALQAGCSPCVGQICQQDSFCCDNEWDEICVSEVWSICNVDCAPGLPSCESQYAGGPGYYFCAQTGALCTMGASLVSTTCNTICAEGGGECEGGYNNDGQCGLGQNIGCNGSGLGTAICLCSRGCGGGPACPNNQICNNGQCQ